MTTLATQTEHPSSNNRFDSGGNVASISDGIIDLFRDAGGRRIKVPKHRGLGQSDRTHSLEIRDHGLEVFAQLIPEGEPEHFEPKLLPVGTDEVDGLVGGGIEANTVTFINGPTGVGKSTLVTQFASTLATNESNVGGYLFEESIDQFLYRADNLGYPLRELCDKESVSLTEIEPLEWSSEEFGQRVMTHVAEKGIEAVFIDGIDGYKVSLQGDEVRLIRRLHALTRSLKEVGVTVFITNEIPQMRGVRSTTNINASYIADNVIYLTYSAGERGLDRAIGVVKKRLGDFDTEFHNFSIKSDSGLQITSPIDDMDTVID